MERRLILISNNGSEDNYLPAVTLDIRHYNSYFKTSEGGAWRDQEIKMFDNNCSRAILHDFIVGNQGVSYFQIVFCGHGYADRYGDTILELQPNKECAVSEIKKWLQNKIGILIADSCRKVYRNPSIITDSRQIRTFSERDSGTQWYRQRCRNLFDSTLEQIPIGYFAEAYACNIGECAHDDDNVGGFYSTALLEEAIEQINREKASAGSIMYNDYIGRFSYIHDNIIEKVNLLSLNESREPQHPVRKQGVLIPFYVVPQTRLYV